MPDDNPKPDHDKARKRAEDLASTAAFRLISDSDWGEDENLARAYLEARAEVEDLRQQLQRMAGAGLDQLAEARAALTPAAEVDGD